MALPIVIFLIKYTKVCTFSKEKQHIKVYITIFSKRRIHNKRLNMYKIIWMQICLAVLIRPGSGDNPCIPNPCGENTRCLLQPGVSEDQAVISCQCLPGKTTLDFYQDNNIYLP